MARWAGMTRWAIGAIGAALFALATPVAAQSPWSPAPWLQDLAAIRAALDSKYANRDWLAHDRAIDLDTVFAATRRAVEGAGSDAAARAAIDRMLARFHDGHVEVDWPAPARGGGAEPAVPQSVCGQLGFTARSSAGIGPALPGYKALPDDGAFPAGTFAAGGARHGILRISEFQPNGMPALCTAAETALGIADDKPCDDACRDRLTTAIYADYTRRFAARIEALKAAGTTALLVDLANNGGGSEWAEAAARMLTAKRLVSEPLGFVRGEHWSKHWREVGDDLRGFLKEAKGAERAALAQWVAQAEKAEREAKTPCAFGSECAWLGRAGFATGLVGSAAAGAFKGKPWGPTVFSPAQYTYRDGVWRGPLLVLVNDETWSAAEEFAAMLQDNRAAVIVGARTGGAGCGHTDGGTPTTLPGGGTLQLPDCARLRKDGSNEINGVVPDQLVAWRYYDSPARAARLLMPALPQAIARARALVAAKKAP